MKTLKPKKAKYAKMHVKFENVSSPWDKFQDKVDSLDEAEDDEELFEKENSKKKFNTSNNVRPLIISALKKGKFR